MKVCARGRSRPALWRKGERSRKVAENGDSLLIGEGMRALPGLEDVTGQLFAVADGLGGEGHDDLASQAAVSALEDFFRGQVSVALEDSASPVLWLQTAYEHANQRVCEEREARGFTGMFTTLTGALVVQEAGGSLRLYPANIGDSRMYLLREGELIGLTRDDGAGGFVTRVIGDPGLFSSPLARTATTLVRSSEQQSAFQAGLRLALKGQLPDLAPKHLTTLADIMLGMLESNYPLELLATLSPAQSRLVGEVGYERFVSVQAILSEKYELLAHRFLSLPLQLGDRLMLCSDGISNAFTSAFLEDALGATAPHQPVGEGLENILTYLMEAMGRIDDDRTVVLIQVTENDPAPAHLLD